MNDNSDNNNQNSQPLAAQQLAGSWNLLAWRYVGADGALTFPYSKAAQGRIIFDVAHSRMAGFLMHPEWQQREGEQRLFLAYSARLELEGDTLLHHVDFASNPRMIGQILRRRATLRGDVLTLETLTTVGREVEDGQHTLIWQRAAPEPVTG